MTNPNVTIAQEENYANHEWLRMSDRELMKSAGLYEKDFVTGETGYNLAAVMLFGKEETIRSCVSGYLMDAIYRADNSDRYDDRIVFSKTSFLHIPKTR